MSLEMDPRDMKHDVQQWSWASQEMASARTRIQGVIDRSQNFGWFEDSIGKPYREASRAIGGFVSAGETTFGSISGAIGAALAENTRRDEEAQRRIAGAGAGGARGIMAPVATGATKYGDRLGGLEAPDASPSPAPGASTGPR